VKVERDTFLNREDSVFVQAYSFELFNELVIREKPSFSQDLASFTPDFMVKICSLE
jgi:hypothetical protein